MVRKGNEHIIFSDQQVILGQTWYLLKNLKTKPELHSQWMRLNIVMKTTTTNTNNTIDITNTKELLMMKPELKMNLNCNIY
jgi:hypothetical protein